MSGSRAYMSSVGGYRTTTFEHQQHHRFIDPTATASSPFMSGQQLASNNAVPSSGTAATSVSPPPRLPPGAACGVMPFGLVEKGGIVATAAGTTTTTTVTTGRSHSAQYRLPGSSSPVSGSGSPSDHYGPSPSVTSSAASSLQRGISYATTNNNHFGEYQQQHHPHYHHHQHHHHAGSRLASSSSNRPSSLSSVRPTATAQHEHQQLWHPYAHPEQQQQQQQPPPSRLSPSLASPTPMSQHLPPHQHQHQQPPMVNTRAANTAPIVRRAASSSHSRHTTQQNNINAFGAKMTSPATSMPPPPPQQHHHQQPFHVKVNFTDNCRVLVHDVDPVHRHVVRHTYVCGKFLGQGAFAKVFQFTDTDTSKHYAAKIVDKSKLVDKKKHKKLMQEIEIHRGISSHPHILRFYDHFQDDSYHYILLEMCTCKSLMEVSRKHGAFTVPEVQYIMAQLLSACHHMHENHVIHRDLKLGNVMIDAEFNMKVGDFGLAAKLEFDGERKRTMCGTPNYIAPEILADSDGYGIEVDIWSLGVILYTLLVGTPPFETADLKTTYSRIKRGEYSFPHNIRLPLEGKALIHKILQCRPERRPSIIEVRNDIFFRLPTSVPRAVPQLFADRVTSVCDKTNHHHNNHPHKQHHQQQQRGHSNNPETATTTTTTTTSDNGNRNTSPAYFSSPPPTQTALQVPLPQTTTSVSPQQQHHRDPAASSSPPARPPPQQPHQPQQHGVVSLPLPPQRSASAIPTNSNNGTGNSNNNRCSPFSPSPQQPTPHPYDNNNNNSNGKSHSDGKVAASSSSCASAASSASPQPLEPRDINKIPLPTVSASGSSPGTQLLQQQQSAKRQTASMTAGSQPLHEQQQAHCSVEMSCVSDSNNNKQSTTAENNNINNNKDDNEKALQPSVSSSLCVATLFWDSRFVMQRAYQSGNVPLKQQPCVWITRYIDLAKKYGFGYYLSSGQLGVYFNDRSKIVWDPATNLVDYYARVKTGGKLKDVLTSFSLAQYPIELEKKVTLTRYFKSYFMKDGIAPQQLQKQEEQQGCHDTVPHQKATVGTVVHCCPPVVSPRPFPLAATYQHSQHQHNRRGGAAVSEPNAPCYVKEFTMLREFTARLVPQQPQPAPAFINIHEQQQQSNGNASSVRKEAEATAQLFDAQLAAPNAIVARLSNGQYQFSYPPLSESHGNTNNNNNNVLSSPASSGIAALQKWLANVDFFVNEGEEGGAAAATTSSPLVLTLCHHVTGKRLSMTKKELCLNIEKKQQQSKQPSAVACSSLFETPLTTLALQLEQRLRASSSSSSSATATTTTGTTMSLNAQIDADDLYLLFALHAKVAALCLRPVKLNDLPI